MFATGMYCGITIYKDAQSPFIGEVDLTPNNDNTDKVDQDVWDYTEYDEYIKKLGDDVEGLDE